MSEDELNCCGQVAPGAIVVEAARGEMSVHLPSGGGGIGRHVGVGVKLREIFLDGHDAGSKGEGLVPVIAGAKVALAKGFGHGDLGQLFAVAEDAEFGFAAQHLAPANQARLAAFGAEPVIVQNFSAAEE
jgi:hypothetical protein